jgi:hypothetical protein
MLQLDTLFFPNIGENGDLPLSGQTRLAETKARRLISSEGYGLRRVHQRADRGKVCDKYWLSTVTRQCARS